jgi:hypothetical protein
LVLVFLLQKKKEKENNGASSEIDMSIDEFIYHFKRMEVNFLYCENGSKEQFENILERK